MKRSLWLLVTGCLVFQTTAAFAQLGAESVTVTSPNGGECLIPGSQVNVTWSSSGVEHVAIGYRTDNNPPPAWQQDFQAWDAHPVFGTTFKWTVPNITSQTVKLWIEGHNASHAKLAGDSSNNTFTISNTCGVDGGTQTKAAPQVTQILIGSTAYQTTDKIQVERGKDLTLVGTAGADEAVTIYVTLPQAQGALSDSRTGTSEEKKLSVTADREGKWTFAVFTKNLSDGEHQVDVETATSSRTKAFSFTVVPVGTSPLVTPPPSTTPTPPISPGATGSVERTRQPFPILPVVGAAIAALIVGIVTYMIVHRRGKRIDETPTEPPQIT